MTEQPSLIDVEPTRRAFAAWLDAALEYNQANERLRRSREINEATIRDVALAREKLEQARRYLDSELRALLGSRIDGIYDD